MINIIDKTNGSLIARDSSILRMTLSEVILVLMFLMLLVSPMLYAVYGGVFKYSDELATVVLALGAILSRKKVPWTNEEKIASLVLSLFCIIGFVGNLSFGYQNNEIAVFGDFFTCLRIFIAYYAAKKLLYEKERYFELLILIGKIFTVVALFFLVLHLSGLFQLGSDRKTIGFYSYQFFYSHPIELGAYCVGISALIFAKKNKKSIIWLLLLEVLIISTQRAKALGIAVVITVFVLYSFSPNRIKRPSLLVMIAVGILAILLAINQIQMYYEDGSSARSLLHTVGFDIALSHFPLGSGFATFGTNMSGVIYSPLYYYYGLNTVYGLFPTSPIFVSDTFWPAVIGQFGILGLLAFLFVIIELYRSIAKQGFAHGVPFVAYSLVPIYLVILSTSDAAFFDSQGPFYAFILASMSLYKAKDTRLQENVNFGIKESSNLSLTEKLKEVRY